MKATHVVGTAFTTYGVSYGPGDQVDAADWPNQRELVDQGYLKPIDGAAVASASSAADPPQGTPGVDVEDGGVGILDPTSGMGEPKDWIEAEADQKDASPAAAAPEPNTPPTPGKPRATREATSKTGKPGRRR